MIKKQIKDAVLSIISTLNKYTPKQNKIVIYSDSILIDNSEAMFRYLNNNSNYKIVCLADKTLKYKLRDNVSIKKTSYIRAIYELLTCKVMIDSFYHAIQIVPSKNQFFVQCWHGSPLKSLASSSTVKKKQPDKYSCYFCASDLFKDHLLTAFGTESKRIITMGNPRNDDLFMFRNHKSEYINVFWMPTYRTGLGHIDSSVDLPILNSDNVGVLNSFLDERKIRLYIKPHRHQMKNFKDILGDTKTSNIRLISENYLNRKNLTVYQLLGQMDALLTDYSSVYFDYLLLNRPIGFVIDDFEEYKKNRGFAFDDPLSLMPGAKIYTFDDLLKFFDDLSNGADDYSDERKKINDLCNYYKDDNNCKRCFELIEKHLRS